MTDLIDTPPANREIELKLAVPADAMTRLRAHPALTTGTRSRAVTRTLESTYFDTPDQRFERSGVTLRVRRAGDAFVQTVKGDGDGLITRGEWEAPVTGPAPDLAAITDETPLALLGPVAADELRPVFATVVRRTIRVIERNGARIEVAFDSGELRLPDGVTAPLSEVELELKAGETDALYDLALELAANAPVRIETRSKSARGYALAAGRLDAPVKAGRLDLTPDTTVEAALSGILSACLLHLSANEASALSGRDQEGVHQMRVALRRMRSAAVLFKSLLPVRDRDWLVAEIKWLGGHLGPARDWDVFLSELLAPLADVVTRTGDAALADDLERLRRAAEAQRQAAYDRVRAALAEPRHALFLLRLAAWINGRGWRNQPVSEASIRLFEPVTALADRLLDRRHRRARRAGRGFGRLAPEARHQVRIALKKLRYAAEFFQGLYDDKPARRYAQTLARLQDALGHLNDVATASRLLRNLHPDGATPVPGEARAAGIVLGWHARGLVDNEPALADLWREFADARPFWSTPPTPV